MNWHHTEAFIDQSEPNSILNTINMHNVVQCLLPRFTSNLQISRNMCSVNDLNNNI